MNTQNLPHAPLLRTLLLGGAFALATLLVAPAALAQVILDQREAETLTLSGGANVSDNGQHVWLDANGATATWVDGGAAGGDTVVASISGSTTNATRVVVTLRVNGVSAGTKIVPVGANAFADYSWTGLSLADSDDLALVTSEVGTNERVYLDKVRVEGPDAPPPPPDVEAETLTLSGGANVSDNGQHVWLDANGATATWVDGGAAGGDTVVASISGSTTNATRVVVTLRVNGVSAGTKIVPVGANAFADYSWTGLSLADSDDLALVTSEVGTNERVYLDKVRVEGPDPDADGDGVPDASDNCPQAPNAGQADLDSDGAGDACDTQDNRDSDSDGVQNYQDQCPNEAGPASNNGCPEVATPPALGSVTGPQTISQNGWTGTLNVQCAGDPQAGTTTTGVKVAADNVHITNLRIRNCNTGLRTSNGAQNLTIDAALFDHNKVSMRPTALDGGNIGDNYGSGPTLSQAGDFKIMDTYRAMESSQLRNVTFHDIYTDCDEGGSGSWGTGAPSGGCHAGFKVLSDRPNGGSHLTSGWVMRDNIIKGVDDESISIDARLNTPSQQAYFGTDPVSAVNATNDTFTLTSGDWGATGENLANYRAILVEGPNQCRSLDITARSGSNFTVSDPNNYLSGVSVGDKITIGEAFEHLDFSNNIVDWTSHRGKVAIDTHAGGCYSKIRDNHIIIPQKNGFAYNPQYFHYRNTGTGTATQAIDIRSAIVGGSLAGSEIIAPSSYNSVTGNVMPYYGDVSLGVVTWGNPGDFRARNYQANNTLAQGQLFWYLDDPLNTDPN